jgi:proline racemase
VSSADVMPPASQNSRAANTRAGMRGKPDSARTQAKRSVVCCRARRSPCGAGSSAMMLTSLVWANCRMNSRD